MHIQLTASIRWCSHSFRYTTIVRVQHDANAVQPSLWMHLANFTVIGNVVWSHLDNALSGRCSHLYKSAKWDLYQQSFFSKLEEKLIFYVPSFLSIRPSVIQQFTEHSSSSIDLIRITNKKHLVLSDAGDPLLQDELRYHCPIFGILKFAKPKPKTFTGHISN